MSIFENEENLLTSICQFDFFQCATTLARTGDVGDIYPSFGIYRKSRITPFIVELIHTINDGYWFSNLSAEILAGVVDALDKIASQEFRFYYDWEYGYWDSQLVSEFIQKHKPKGNS